MEFESYRREESRESIRQGRRDRPSGGWRWSLSRTAVKKNPQHLWVLLFGAASYPPRRDTHRACESWRTSRRALEKKGTYRPYYPGSSRNMCKMEVVPAELGASYRHCGRARTSKWSQELSSRCIGGWPRQEHRPEPRSIIMICQPIYVATPCGESSFGERTGSCGNGSHFLCLFFACGGGG